MRRLRYKRNAFASVRPLVKAAPKSKPMLRMRRLRYKRKAFASVRPLGEAGSVRKIFVANAEPAAHKKRRNNYAAMPLLTSATTQEHAHAKDALAANGTPSGHTNHIQWPVSRWGRTRLQGMSRQPWYWAHWSTTHVSTGLCFPHRHECCANSACTRWCGLPTGGPVSHLSGPI